ncbi:hypothetical protein [Halobacterium zhouii]|uniref:hypothetical protein n=1 Tax=Halobacterium zhouii TaxID=2902624 RepID=UPI001E29B5A0|nr:hypothetical protein [Halobacterium zhouii]
MHEPPSTPRNGPLVDQPTWRGVLAVYAVMAAVPLSLFTASNPLAGAAVVASLGALAVSARRTATLVECFNECQGFAFDVAGRVRITVAHPSNSDGCQPA